MQWYDYHLYIFAIGERRFEDGRIDEAEEEDARKVTLGSLGLGPGDGFPYEYDLGDSWEHDVIVEKVEPWRESMWLPWVEGGAYAAPPEDAGGTYGFEEMKEAWAHPDHPEHESYKEWAGEDYDPHRWGRGLVRARRLQAFASSFFLKSLMASR